MGKRLRLCSKKGTEDRRQDRCPCSLLLEGRGVLFRRTAYRGLECLEMRSRMNISDMLSADRIVDLKATKKNEVLKEMVDVIATAPEITDKQAFLKAILEREKIMSTGIGIGVAIPHAKIPSVKDFVMAIGRARQGIDFDALDDKPVYLVVMIGASDQQKDEFLKVLARVSLLLKNRGLRKWLMEAEGPQEIMALLAEK